MHEFSLCQELTQALLQEMARLQPPPSRLLSARVVVGALRQIVPETLIFAYETLTKNTPASGSRLEIRPAPLRLACRACGRQQEIAHWVPACPACGSPDLDLQGGMELYLDHLEVEVDDAPGN